MAADSPQLAARRRREAKTLRTSAVAFMQGSRRGRERGPDSCVVNQESVISLLEDNGSQSNGISRRSAACVKACEGIPTELLERRFLLRLIAACVHITDGRVRELLEELALGRLRPMDPDGSITADRSRGATAARSRRTRGERV